MALGPKMFKVFHGTCAQSSMLWSTSGQCLNHCLDWKTTTMTSNKHKTAHICFLYKHISKHCHSNKTVTLADAGIGIGVDIHNFLKSSWITTGF